MEKAWLTPSPDDGLVGGGKKKRFTPVGQGKTKAHSLVKKDGPSW